MKKHYFWTIVLAAVAAYLIATSFIPNLHIIVNSALFFTVFFLFFGLSDRSLISFFIGLASLSIYLKGIYHFSYAKWPLFFGIVLIGIVFDQLVKPKKDRSFIRIEKSNSSYVNDDQEVYAKTLFSENTYYVTSQNLNTIYADAKFGELNLDLRQAQFMTDSPEINVQVKFGEANIRIPQNWRIDTKQVNSPFGSVAVSGERFLDEEATITVTMTGSTSFGQVNISY